MTSSIDTAALIMLAKQSFSARCDHVFKSVVPRYTKSVFFHELETAPIQQYPSIAGKVPSHERGADADTALDQPRSPIRLFPNFYGNDRSYQAFVLIHEGVHRFTRWDDVKVFMRFAPYGLKAPGSGYGTGNFTTWLQGGCKP